MAENVLDAIKKYKPPEKIHPIAKRAFERYRDADWKMSVEIIEAIRDDLDALGDDLKELSDAMFGLAAMAGTAAETYGDTAAGEMLGKLLHEQGPKYSTLSEKILDALQNLGIKTKEAFTRFIDQDNSAATRAPALNEKPPEGAVAVKNLQSPAAPPAWARLKEARDGKK